jgi:hypothetical protein
LATDAAELYERDFHAWALDQLLDDAWLPMNRHGLVDEPL